MLRDAQMEVLPPLKDKPLRNPGQWLDEEIDRQVNDGFMPYFISVVLFWALTGMEALEKYRHLAPQPAIFGAIAIVATILAAIRFRKTYRIVQNLRQGRDGERAVGQYLERLRAHGAEVFHDIPGDGFNLDHVVIASQGVFAIETKAWSRRSATSRIRAKDGALYKEGQKVDPNPVEQVAASAKWLAELLKETTGKSLPVQGIVVFPGWFVEPMDAATKSRAWVLSPKAVPAFVAKEPNRLLDPDVRLAAFHLGRYVRAKEAK